MQAIVILVFIHENCNVLESDFSLRIFHIFGHLVFIHSILPCYLFITENLPHFPNSDVDKTPVLSAVLLYHHFW